MKQSHQDKELQISVVNSTVGYMQKNDLKKKGMILTDQKQEQTEEEKAAMMRRCREYLSSHKIRSRLRSTVSKKKVKRVTAMEYALKT